MGSFKLLNEPLNGKIGHYYTFVASRTLSLPMSPFDRHSEAVTWSMDQFGNPGWWDDINARWYSNANNCAIGFRDESDAAAFKLRWC